MIKSVEIFSVFHKNKMIFIGRSCLGAEDCVRKHFQNCFRNYDKYIEFYPKFYKFILKNPKISEYSISSFGMFTKEEALNKTRELIVKYRTANECNSYRREKDPDPIIFRDGSPDKIKLERYFITCDQTGERFNSLEKCAEFYGVTKSTIMYRTRKKIKKMKNKSKNDKISGLTFSNTRR